MIVIKNLCKKFDDLEVIKDLSIEISKGETIVILGRSGVGKSVLLKHIMGLIKPDSGYIEIQKKRITDLEGSLLFDSLKNVGMLFQGSALFDSLNVYENVAFYLNQHKTIPDSEIQERVKLALNMVDLQGVEEKMPANLSGGMKKRVALARLIVYRPNILLYDEPTTGIDPITAMHINELIIRTKEELQATSIVVTHDIASALTVGDRLALQLEGKIASFLPKEEFLASDNPHIQEFLKLPVPTKRGA